MEWLCTPITPDKSVVQITPDENFEETCLLEIGLRGGDLLLFGCFYGQRQIKIMNHLLRRVTEKIYSRICLVGYFNFRDINWNSWTSPHNEESKGSKFIDTDQSSTCQHHAPDVITFKFYSYLDYSISKERFVYDRTEFGAMKNQLVEIRWKEEYLRSGQNKTVEELWRILNSSKPRRLKEPICSKDEGNR